MEQEIPVGEFVENGRRAGRSWTGPKGPVVEINAVAELLHEYADTAGLSIKAVHEALTPEMLPAGTRVPDLRRMYDLMDGRDLSRAIAHAVIDVCSGLDGDPGSTRNGAGTSTPSSRKPKRRRHRSGPECRCTANS